MEDLNKRFRGLEWFDSKSTPNKITIGGQGGIGSWLTLMLSKICTKKTMILCYDDDVIEEHNIGGQLFSKKSIGSNKAIEMMRMVSNYGIAHVSPMPCRITEKTAATPVMFACFDNIESREMMFEKWLKLKAKNKLFVDGRLLAETYEIFFVTIERADEYRKHLFKKGELEAVPCTTKQTSHFAAAIAADMIKGYTNWLAIIEEKDPEDSIRQLPFRIKEIGELFHKITESC